MADCLFVSSISNMTARTDTAAVLCRCYLVQRQRAEQLGRAAPGFTRWVEDRRELSYLLNHANLNT